MWSFANTAAVGGFPVVHDEGAAGAEAAVNEVDGLGGEELRRAGIVGDGEQSRHPIGQVGVAVDDGGEDLVLGPAGVAELTVGWHGDGGLALGEAVVDPVGGFVEVGG